MHYDKLCEVFVKDIGIVGFDEGLEHYSSYSSPKDFSGWCTFYWCDYGDIIT